MSGPPAVGKPLSVRVDAVLYDDLATLMRTGMTASDAVRHAVEVVAEIYRGAWSAGACPEGTEPRITGANVAPTSTHDKARPVSDARPTPVGQPV